MRGQVGGNADGAPAVGHIVQSVPQLRPFPPDAVEQRVGLLRRSDTVQGIILFRQLSVINA